MLNVKIVCVGTLREQFLRDAVKEYEKRLQAYCKLTTVELKSDAQLPSAVEGKSYKIALCVEGKQISSEELSALIEKGTVTGQGNITLVIGGADGLPEAVKAMCDYRLSFSKMTFPHQLMRVILLEQLYRALNILGGGHYHH
jgi:23S rRNA (pseudouridine1915-N3)-methyltransferase